MKRCPRCEQTKPHEEFNKNKSRKDGLSDACTLCTRETVRLSMEKRRRANGVPAQTKVSAEEQRIRWRVANHKRRKHYSYGDFTAADWSRLTEEYGAACMKCGAEDDLSLDHVIPISLFGEHTLSNAQILCLGCNKQKGNRSCADYRPYLAFGEQDYTYEIPVGLYREVIGCE